MIKSYLTTVISFAICLLLTLGLNPITLGIASGLFAGGIVQEISNILKSKGVEEPNISEADYDDWYKNLPLEIRKDIDNAVKTKMRDLWFGINSIASAFSYAIIGFLYGFINRTFIAVGLFVLLSFALGNPVINFCAKELGLLQKIIIVAVAQFGACYLFGYLGTLIGKKLFGERTTDSDH